MSIRLASLALVATAVLVPTARARGPAPAITRLVIFGDSLSDTGNVDDLTVGIVPGAPYWQGRFSNGPVWVESLAAAVGAPAPLFSRDGGTNYAHGGARTGSGFVQFLIPNVGTQINSYLNNGPDAAPGDLFVILAGGNDFFDGQTNPATPVANLQGHLTTLAANGADRFLVVSLPPLGQTPGALGSPDEAVFDALTVQFNDLYADLLDDLATSLGVTIHRLDGHGLMSAFLDDPGAYGFTNVTDPAYDEGSGTIVPDPDDYLFWDDLHPTTAGHDLVGARAAARLHCPADLDADGAVDVADLVAVILQWGAVGFSPADANDDGVVDVGDLVDVIVAWGGC